MRRLVQIMRQALLAQRGHMFPWVPVFLGLGIGWYFTLRQEPGPELRLALPVLTVVLSGLAWGASRRDRPLLQAGFVALALIAGGMWLAAERAARVSAPVLGYRYYGPVEGRIIGMDRSASDALRLTLDQVRLGRMAPARTPARVRISLHGDGGTVPRPGQRVMTTGHLSPPGGPVEPGGFDFRRHAWFQKLGAVGYTRIPLLGVAPPEPGAARIFRARMALAEAFRQALPGETGAFAAAITAGDRSGMGQETLQALRVANLAHLLAISGLHMGLLTGFVFLSLRRLLAVSERLALHLPLRSIAAAGALVVAVIYLGLSGGSIATERAFVMVAVVLVAAMALRRALTLRAVALAALVVLGLRPEALLSPGFQMSFAATLALVWIFSLMTPKDGQGAGWPGRGWRGRVLTLVISSAVAGAATAPVAAAQFNQLAHYGLLANLLSVPVMGTLVMPAALVSVLLMPLGLEALPMTLMGWGLDWILAVARFTAGLEGARGTVPSPPPVALPMLCLGGLFVILWAGRARWLGVAPVALALILWQGTTRPDILIAETGGLVGVMTPEGRALSRERSESFTARVWLENDGDKAQQLEAAGRWQAGTAIRHATGKRAAGAAGPCEEAEILVLNVEAALASRATGCEIYDPARLRRTGAVAIYLDKQLVVTASETDGTRYWNSPELSRSPGLWASLGQRLSRSDLTAARGPE
ncbi:competence protein ComEC [Pseudooceanicola antarcticus]|uniref:Competence protein ComEC n=2 Tax=Pseudooceanicola antarcticus TaxID=1247613 RepID=A0A285J5Q5_9RHOB|nr:competence protein ComEC [Pseudooceanicola antarcticus]